jgi:hypothetical protein
MLLLILISLGLVSLIPGIILFNILLICWCENIILILEGLEIIGLYHGKRITILKRVILIINGTEIILIWLDVISRK